MKLIDFTIHRNVAPPVQATPFQPANDPKALIVSFAIQIEDDGKALSFASDVMKTIDQYINIKE